MALHLVTGGAGFIGSTLVRALATAGERVRVVDDLSTGYWENLDDLRGSTDVECITADIRDPEAMNRAAAGVDRAIDANGYVAPKHFVDRSQR